MDSSLFEAKLTAELDILKKELDELGFKDPLVENDWIASTADETQNEADQNVVADRTEEWETRNSEMNELETRFRNVITALEKIKLGSFGLCELCNQPIEEARLNVNPAARTCLTHLNDEADLPL